VQTISGPSPVSSYAIRPPGTSRNFVFGMTARLLETGFHSDGSALANLSS
jgi:hypothetical protein